MAVEQLEHPTPEEQISRTTQASSGLWEFLGLVRRDLTVTSGKSISENPKVLSEDAIVIGQVAGVPDFQRDRWLSDLIYTDGDVWIADSRHTSVKQYFNFFDNLGISDRTQFEGRIGQILRANPELVNFFDRLVSINPLVGTASILLYENPSSKLAWFKESIERANQTDEEIGRFFGRMQVRVSRLGEDPLLNNFLQDWSDDLRLNVAEVVNLASGMAIHVQQPDNCAVLMSAVPIAVTQGDFYGARRDVLSLLGPANYPDGRMPLYRRFSQPVFDYLNKLSADEGFILVPSYTSIDDINSFLNFYQRFWNQLSSGLKDQGGYKLADPENSDESTIKLGNAGTILLRALPRQGEQSAEARIALLGTSQFLHFNTRVDSEKRRGGLSLDIGGLDFEHAIAYARHLAQEDEQADFVQTYDQIIDVKGKIKPRNRRSFYPSIMSAPGFADGHRAALFVSLAMHEGYSVGLRQSGDYFAYHSREKLAKNPQYSGQFPQIVKDLENVLTTAIN